MSRFEVRATECPSNFKHPELELDNLLKRCSKDDYLKHYGLVSTSIIKLLKVYKIIAVFELNK